jgi:hypothetical protein
MDASKKRAACACYRSLWQLFVLQMPDWKAQAAMVFYTRRASSAALPV